MDIQRSEKRAEFSGSVIGTKTQDLNSKVKKLTFVSEKCEIRECVTINSSCGEESTVSVGDNCLIMAYCMCA